MNNVTPIKPEPTEDRFPALTEEEAQAFNHLRDVITITSADNSGDKGFRVAIMRVEVNGKPEAAIVMTKAAGEDVSVLPLALLCSETLFELVTPAHAPGEEYEVIEDEEF